MDIKFSSAAFTPAQSFALPVSSSKTLSTAHAKLLGKTLTDTLNNALKAGTAFQADKEQMLWLHGIKSGTKTISVLLYGVGKPNEMSVLDSLKLGGLLAAQAKAQNIANLHVVVNEAIDVQQCALGATLRSYQFSGYKTTAKDTKSVPLKQVTLHVGNAKQAQKDWVQQNAIAEGVYLARDLMNQPPNICTPENFVAAVRDAVKSLPVTLTVLDEKTIAKKGLGALQAVARGSRHPAYVLIAEYNGLAPTGKTKAKTQPIALVGKGVTFDTGGYNLKPGTFVGGGMFDMKYDMGGAAAVMGSILALAQGAAATHVVGIVGLTENLVDEDAYLPGEVVTTLSGQTVEIMDTDAEGRLVLADLLTYVQQQHKPHTIIDIATLTGSAMSAFGNEYAALFSNQDELANQLQQSGMKTGEKCWRMPIDAAPAHTLKSTIADFVNVELSRLAGASFAALFLSQFVEKDVNWAHLDIAGLMKAKADMAICPAGGMGFGIRLMVDYVLSQTRNG